MTRCGFHLDQVRFDLASMWILWDPIWFLCGLYGIGFGFDLDLVGFDSVSIWVRWDSIWIS